MPKKPSNKEELLYIRGFPNALKALFKAWCARQGISMKQKITEMMLDCVKRDEPEGRRRLKTFRDKHKRKTPVVTGPIGWPDPNE